MLPFIIVKNVRSSMMRAPLIAAIAVLAILSAAVLAAPADADGEEPIEFAVGPLVCEVIGPNEVAVIDYDTETGGVDATVPPSVEFDGREYTVTTIGSGAFNEEHIVTLSIPETVSEFYNPFMISRSIESVTVDPRNPYYLSDDGVLISTWGNLLMYPTCKADLEYNIPSFVNAIGSNAFASNEILRKVTIPYGISVINNSTFMDCLALESVVIEEDSFGNKSIIAIDELAFMGCISLTSFELPDGLKTIGYYAFMRTGLTSVNIPYSVTFIDEGAFAWCSDLVSFESDNEKYVVSDGILFEKVREHTAILAYPAQKPDEQLYIPANVDVASMAFAGCKNLKRAEIAEGITAIADDAFYGCESLESVKIPNSVLSLGHLSFCDCTSLKDIEFGNGLVVISYSALSDNAIERLILPDSVLYIDAMAISDNRNLTYVEFPESSEAVVEGYAFSGCYALTDIVILGTDVMLEPDSLSVGDSSNHVTLNLTLREGLDSYDDLWDGDTTVNVKILGERPYPYENLIGVAVCIVILACIILAFREV